MESESLEYLYLGKLMDLYDVEKQLVPALPRFARAASSSELKQVFIEHLEVTLEHIARLEQIFMRLEMRAQGSICKPMKGLINEGNEAIREHRESERDAALIETAQRIEEYEISSYGLLLNFARDLGQDEAVRLIEETLDEERDAEEAFTRVAGLEVDLHAMAFAGHAN